MRQKFYRGRGSASDPSGELSTLSRPPVGWGEDTPSPHPTSQLAPSAPRPSRLRIYTTDDNNTNNNNNNKKMMMMRSKVSYRNQTACQHSVTEIFGEGRGRGRSSKIFRLSTLIIIQNLVTVRGCRTSQHIWDARGPPFPMRAWLTH